MTSGYPSWSTPRGQLLEMFAQEPEGALLAWELGIGADLFDLRGLEGALVL
ncbi:hypothetical protein Mrose_02008 [Calidithermus roseus]|uniref:Uncharacterized protein n=1 Tax=Calidithermus roseus TaxID=1644118 RepID=A0A399EQW1_9DEIN|nr:hypothetical protein Mrose_02008 [Calidithermus roseus]